jgi:hypothetical protein
LNAAPFRLPAALRESTVAAWQKAGATFGYMRTDDDHDGLWFRRDDFKPDCPDLPAFAIEWQDFVHCSRLPEPEVPFALLLSPREFDYTGKRPPPKKPPAGFTDVDVSNILRVRHLRLSEGEGVEMQPLISGLQRLRQLETLQHGSQPFPASAN